MKKQKNRKFNPKSFWKDMNAAILKISLNAAVIAIFIAISFLLAKAYLYRSDYFRLRKVEIKDTLLDQRSLISIRSRIFSAYKEKSVFGLDLKAIAQNLQSSYPDAKDISVMLALPDKMVISLKLRKPVLLVKSDKLYPVDEEGVILPIADASSLKWVPSVDGVQVAQEARKAKAITSRNLKAAIELLRSIKGIRAITDYGIESVDVRDLSNISFYLKNGIEIRMGSENFKDRLIVLAKTLRDPRMVMDRIKYIDLRFGDAIIGPR